MVRVNASRTSRGAHAQPRALHACISAVLEALPDLPDYRRVQLRDALRSLERQHKELALTESDVAQLLAEEDGEAHEDVP